MREEFVKVNEIVIEAHLGAWKSGRLPRIVLRLANWSDHSPNRRKEARHWPVLQGRNRWQAWCVVNGVVLLPAVLLPSLKAAQPASYGQETKRDPIPHYSWNELLTELHKWRISCWGLKARVQGPSSQRLKNRSNNKSSEAIMITIFEDRRWPWYMSNLCVVEGASQTVVCFCFNGESLCRSHARKTLSALRFSIHLISLVSRYRGGKSSHLSASFRCKGFYWGCSTINVFFLVDGVNCMFLCSSDCVACIVIYYFEATTFDYLLNKTERHQKKRVRMCSRQCTRVIVPNCAPAPLGKH